MFIGLIIPFLILWVSLVTINIENEKRLIIDNTLSELRINDESKAVLVQNYVSKVIENLKVVRDADEVSTYIHNKTELNKEEMKGLFYRIMVNKEDYYQLRYIDAKGDESIRIENKGSIRIFTDQELENQKDSDYFIEGMTLTQDEIYMSPLDLNIEDGVIEEPYVPVIRFVTPVINNEGDREGIIVINYAADYLIQLMSDNTEYNEFMSSQFYLLTSTGDYIVHDNPDNNFSYVLGSLQENRYSNDYSEIWDVMMNDGFIGDYHVDHTVISYYDLLSRSKDLEYNTEQQWIAVHVLDSSNMSGPVAVLKEIGAVYNLFIGVLILLVIYMIAIAIDQLHAKDIELDITQKIAGSTSDSVIITDAKTNITYVNEAYEEATGYTKDEVIGKRPSAFQSGKHNKEFYRGMWQSIGDNGYWEGTLWDKKKDGLLYAKRLKIVAVRDKRSKTPHHYVGIFSDLSTSKRKTDSFEALNYHDGRMVVPNEEIMIELLNQSVQNENFSFMVVYIAIENFNQLSNLFEDQINLTEVFTNLIQQEIQEDDFIAQTGRNLFALVIGMHNITVEPKEYTRNLHKNLSRVFEVDDRDVFFKTRIGVSFWPNETDDIKKLLLHSMIALEWTSHRNESEIAYYEDYMINELNQENEIESYLRKAITNDEFFMVYQPQIDIQTGDVVGMEALLRWKNKDLGFVSPALFIPIAEKNHLMIEIGDWILNRVCGDLKVMNENCYLAEKHLRCAINLSPMQMEELGFIDKLLSIIDEHQLSYTQLEMEITENLILNDKKNNIRLLEDMRQKGMTVAIDDFGTGYSSLSYLNLLPIDKIKIDRSFIKNYPENDNGKLARILINMSQTLGLKVLMEGAETEEQVEFLKDEGCHFIQGYYYSKPLEKDAFIQFINRH
jgi:PAS domain S-box-containing protein